MAKPTLTPLLLSLLLSIFCASQNSSSKKPLFTWYEYSDSSIYTAMHKLMDGIFPVSYVSLRTMSIGSIERPVPLREGEGKNGYLLETYLDQVFPLIFNKNQEGHFTQTFLCSFRYAPAFRITKDDSYALIPTNQKVGLHLDKVLWDSETKFIFTSPRGHRYDFIGII